ncbi:MAG: hypothetical protein QOI41_3597, partial [Myxococcales bacterium]|nr:hypothetical protein [Myxococcales bacterium]
MRTFKGFGAVTVAAMAMAMVACGGGGDAAGDGTGTAAGASALTFEAAVSPLSSFKFDTGLIPEGSPAQVQLTLSAGGGLTVEAAAEPSSGALAGKPGGGKLSIDLHMKLAGRLKVESTFKSYDGELPGLKDIDIPITGSVPFDGLLLDAAESAQASADLPETTLPEIPLGSIPGSLILTVAQGSKLTSKFHATCLSVADGTATYSGQSTTGGTLVLKGKIVLKLPAPLNKSIDIPDITVPIPEVTTATNAAPLTVSGIDDASTGACGGAASKPGTNTGGSSPGASSDNGSGSSDPGTGDGTGTGTGTGGAPSGGGGSPDGGAPDSGSTTPPAPVCNDSNDAPGTEATGRSFSTNDGVDTATTVNGVLNGASDVDYYTGTVTDGSFALLQPNIVNATSGAELCVFVKCGGGHPTTLSCSSGTATTNENGTKGCCGSGSGAVNPSWDCSGTLDETATVSFRVKNKSNACLP